MLYCYTVGAERLVLMGYYWFVCEDSVWSARPKYGEGNAWEMDWVRDRFPTEPYGVPGAADQTNQAPESAHRHSGFSINTPQKKTTARSSVAGGPGRGDQGWVVEKCYVPYSLLLTVASHWAWWASVPSGAAQRGKVLYGT